MSLFMAAAVVAAYFVKGVCGFANTLVFTTIMSFRMANVSLSPIDLLVGYPANLMMAWQERRHTRVIVWVPLAIMVLLGSIPGALLLKTGNIGVIKLCFGILVIGIGVEMLFRERQQGKVKAPRWVMLFIGLLSGLLCGLYGIGALLAAYVSRTSENSSQFRGDMCLVFSLENTFRIILYLAMGILTGPIALAALKLVPFMLLGLGLGIWTAKRVPEKQVKRIVILALIISGVALVLNNL